MTELKCACGEVALHLEGTHIMATECLCSECQQAGKLFADLPQAMPVLDEKSATGFVLYRKDRVQCVKGAGHLCEHKLKADSKTRRIIAGCCNTPMFLEFTQGHWLSIYTRLWPENSAPSLDMRTMAGEAPDGVVLPENVPNAKRHDFRFFARLLLAWAAMGFRAPRIDYVRKTLNA
jgi:hypothetical protein